MHIRLFTPLWLLLVMLCLLTCKKDDDPNDRLRISSVSVSNINQTGANFNSSFGQAGADPIIDHGFVYGTTALPTLTNAESILLGASGGNGSFSARANHAMETGQTYYVSAFAKTAKNVCYSEPVSFISLGSAAPAITAIVPAKGVAGDTLTIRGQNFSRLTANNVVRFNTQDASVLAATDTAIRVRIPSSKGIDAVEISIKTAGQTVTSQLFSYLKPEIIDFWPKTGIYMDTVYVKERNYSRKSAVPSFMFGDAQANIISVKDSTFKMVIPSSKGSEKQQIVCSIDGFVNATTGYFTYRIPAISKIEPSEGVNGDIIHIKGKDFGHIPSEAKIMFGGKDAFIIDATDTTIFVIAPVTGSGVENAAVIALVDGRNVTSPQNFRYRKPVVTSFSPQSGCGGDTITIKGKYMQTTDQLKLSFGAYAVTKFVSVTDTVIKALVPASNGLEQTIININNNGLIGSSTGSFRYLKPVITNFTPQKGVKGDTIIITGQNFGLLANNLSVYIGEEKATIIGQGKTQIKIRAPEQGYLISQAVLRVIRDGIGTDSSIKFEHLPPVISDFSPKVGAIGDVVTLYGNNFGHSANEVTVNVSYPVRNFLYFSNTKIQFVVPPLGSNSVTIEVERRWQKATSTGLFTFRASKITGFSQPTGRAGDIITVYGEDFPEDIASVQALLDEQYLTMISCAKQQIQIKLPMNIIPGVHKFKIVSGDMQVDAPATFLVIGDGPWTKKTSLPTEARSFPYAYSYNGNGYVGMGAINYQRSSHQDLGDCWKYDPATDSWTLIGDNPAMKRRTPTFFQVNNRIYIGGGIRNDNIFNDFYNSPSGSANWSAQTFQHPAMAGAASFVIDGKVYICGGIYTDKVWQYDPSTDQWAEKTPMPGGSRYWAFSFAANGKGYVGYGKQSSNMIHEEMLEYNPQTDTWVEKSGKFPGGQAVAACISFTVNGRIFVGLGEKFSTYWVDPIRDIWEYHPGQDQWKYVATIPGVGGLGAYVFVIGNKAYIGGGHGNTQYNYTTSTTDFYEFDPSKL